MIVPLAATSFALALIVPPVATAANFCVGPGVICTGAPFSADVTGIQSAVAAANSNPGTDNILLAAGPYTLGGALTMTFTGSQEVHLIGAGAGQTVFSGSVASSPQLTFDFANATSDATGFTLNVPGTPSNATGIQVFKGGISDFSVTQPGGLAQEFHAVSLDGSASATRGAITITSGNGVGLLLKGSPALGDDGAGTASEITLNGPAAAASGILVDSNSGPAKTFDRMRINRFGRGVEVTSGSFKLTNSVIDMGTQIGGLGLDALNGIGSSDIFADVSRVTIVGTGELQTALLIGAGSAGIESFSGGFFDMVLYAAGPTSNALICQGGTAISLTAAINSYAAKGADLDLNGCSTTENNKIDLSATDPGFRDLTGGDFRLKPSSPLIDRGFAGEVISPTERDLIGKTRVVDGDGNGNALVDIGAFEYQRTAPSVSAQAGSAPAIAGSAASFEATASDADGEAVSLSWSFDDGGSATGATVTHAFATSGAHTATVTATDEAGLKSTATTVVNVAAAPPTATLTKKPKAAFKITKKAFAIAKAKQQSFTVTFANSAKAKFTLQQKRKGKFKNLKGSQTLSVKNGAVKLTFGGKFNKKLLKSGSYLVSIRPQAASGESGKPVLVGFKLK